MKFLFYCYRIEIDFDNDLKKTSTFTKKKKFAM